MKYYKISEKELHRLLSASVELDALESAGVDNWHYYGYHYEDYHRFVLADKLTPKQNEELSIDEFYWEAIDMYVDNLIEKEYEVLEE